MKCLATLSFLLIITTACRGSEIPKMELESHFEALSTPRHPHYNEGRDWIEGREYVKEKMRYYGLRTIEEQVFNITVGGIHEEGVNLVGIAEGDNTEGPVIVVGADYSTKRIPKNLLKDNTGGIACFLETIHLFLDRVYWNPYFQNFTVIFVAFDLNTKEYEGSEMGKSGSYYFIHEWLLPYLEGDKILHKKHFQGAIILDSVTTYNPVNKTQTLRQGFNEAMPNAFVDIKEDGLKGDFLGFLYTSKEKENEIVKTFFTKYNRDLKFRPYRLQEMELHLSMETLEDDVLEMFNHQSHFYFWTNSEGGSMPAFLLFDTDEDRIDPTPNACTNTECNVNEFLTEERIGFMTHTTNTLVSTLLELQTTVYELPPSAGIQPTPSLLLVTLVTFILAMIFKH